MAKKKNLTSKEVKSKKKAVKKPVAKKEVKKAEVKEQKAIPTEVQLDSKTCDVPYVPPKRLWSDTRHHKVVKDIKTDNPFASI
tara:strand:- start:384 stop:632 length:249 start_codon:yes stop_codon:yes gene_type:complete